MRAPAATAARAPPLTPQTHGHKHPRRVVRQHHRRRQQQQRTERLVNERLQGRERGTAGAGRVIAGGRNGARANCRVAARARVGCTRAPSFNRQKRGQGKVLIMVTPTWYQKVRAGRRRVAHRGCAPYRAYPRARFKARFQRPRRAPQSLWCASERWIAGTVISSRCRFRFPVPMAPWWHCPTRRSLASPARWPPTCRRAAPWTSCAT